MEWLCSVLAKFRKLCIPVGGDGTRRLPNTVQHVGFVQRVL